MEKRPLQLVEKNTTPLPPSFKGSCGVTSFAGARTPLNGKTLAVLTGAVPAVFGWSRPTI